MLTPTTAQEHRLTFDGYGYLCRVVEQPSPDTQPIVILGGSEEDRLSWVRYERRLVARSSPG